MNIEYIAFPRALSFGFFVCIITQNILSVPASVASRIVAYGQIMGRRSLHSSCYKEIAPLLAQADFVPLCEKLADRMLAQPETINWHMSPYDSMQSYDRAALAHVFSHHMGVVGFKKIKELERGLGRNLPFLIEYADHGIHAHLALTLFDIFKQEHAFYNSLLEIPYIKASFEMQQRNRLQSLVVATSCSVRLLDVALKEAARRIDDM